MINTLAYAKRYRAAGFSDAQVDALVERDQIAEAARAASSLPRNSQLAVNANPSLLDRILANHWRLALTVATIVIVGFWDTMTFLALKYWIFAGK